MLTQKTSGPSVLQTGRVLFLPLGAIRPNPAQPRSVFDAAGLQELAASIRQYGVLQPLSVRKKGSGFELVAGERRLRAAKIAGLREVPCLVLPADHKRSAVLALAENMQRQPLTCFEQAAALRGIMRRFRLDEDEAARLLGCTPAAVTQMLQLLALSPREQATLTEHGLGAPHARALLRERDADRREALLRQMIAKKEPSAGEEPPKPEPKSARRAVPVVRDMRLFFNTLNHAVDTMRRSGIDAQISQTECDGFMEMTVRVPCMTVRKPA